MRMIQQSAFLAYAAFFLSITPFLLRAFDQLFWIIASEDVLHVIREYLYEHRMVGRWIKLIYAAFCIMAFMALSVGSMFAAEVFITYIKNKDERKQNLMPLLFSIPVIIVFLFFASVISVAIITTW